MSNTLRYYYDAYQSALQSWKNGQQQVAEYACRELVTDFQCPRLIQVQAWQLRSCCAKGNYWLAKSHLMKATEVIEKMNDPGDELVMRAKTHTESMLAKLESKWKAEWEARGVEPPAKKPLEETYIADSVKPGGELDVERQRKRVEKMNIEGEDGVDSSDTGDSAQVHHV